MSGRLMVWIGEMVRRRWLNRYCHRIETSINILDALSLLIFSCIKCDVHESLDVAVLPSD